MAARSILMTPFRFSEHHISQRWQPVQFSGMATKVFNIASLSHFYLLLLIPDQKTDFCKPILNRKKSK
jgi:hypothetical protein